MNESMIITIEEWSGEHGLEVTEEQANELVDALEVCGDSHFRNVGKSKKDEKIEQLENKVRILESFIRSKGHSIDVRENGVIEYTEESISVSHVASREIFHQF